MQRLVQCVPADVRGFQARTEIALRRRCAPCDVRAQSEGRQDRKNHPCTLHVRHLLVSPINRGKRRTHARPTTVGVCSQAPPVCAADHATCKAAKLAPLVMRITMRRLAARKQD
jgi:hypothetical protein